MKESSVRLLALSDTHTFFPELDTLPEADLLVHCGDWTDSGYGHSGAPMRAVEAWVKQAKRKYPYVLALHGNHDVGVRNRHWQAMGAVALDGLTWTHPSGLTFHGVALTPAYDFPEMAWQWDHMTYEPEVEAAAWQFGKVDVVVAHGPPWGYLDRSETGRHIGSRMALEYIREHQPRLYLCGHAHSGRGEAQVRETRIVNVAGSWTLLELI